MKMSIKIVNFAIFKDVALCFEKPLVLMLGAPGTGKSLLIKLITVAMLACGVREWDKPSKLLRQELDALVPNYEEVMTKDSVVDINIDNICVYRVKSEPKEYIALPRVEKRLGVLWHVPLLEERVQYFRNVLYMLSKHRSEQGTELQGHRYIEGSTLTLGPIEKHYRHLIDRVSMDNEVENCFRRFVHQFMKTMRDDVPLKPIDLVELRTYYNVPLVRESFTLLNLALLALGLAYFVTKKNTVLILDSPEFGLTLKQLSVVAKNIAQAIKEALERGNNMMILTTHNPLLLATLSHEFTMWLGKKVSEYVEQYELKPKRDRVEVTRVEEPFSIPEYLVDGYRSLINEYLRSAR